MSPFSVRLLAVASLALVLGWTALRAEPAAQLSSEKTAKNALTKLSDRLADKDVSEQASKIVKEHDSCDISSVFRIQTSGGLGIGKLTEAGFRDSIQHLITGLSNRKNTTEQMFEQYQADLIR